MEAIFKHAFDHVRANGKIQPEASLPGPNNLGCDFASVGDTELQASIFLDRQVDTHPRTAKR